MFCPSRLEPTGKDGDNVPVLGPIVTFHDKLVSPGDQGQAVVVVESLRDILAKGIPSTTRRDAPAASVIGVRPEQVAHGSLMGHFLYPIEGADVIKGINARRQSTVKTEDLVVDQGGKRQVVEQIGEVFPHVGIAVLAQALVVEAVHLRDLPRLMVSTQNRDALGVSDLERDQESHSLDGEVTTIDIVTWIESVYPCRIPGAGRTHEEVIRVRVGPANFEQLHQVMELAMYIAADCDGTFL